MPRSLKKGPFVDNHLLNKVVVQNEAGTKNIHGRISEQLRKNFQAKSRWRVSRMNASVILH